jgi:predicted RNA binding protein YcfA (HicA-like mRNA interferase family)
MKVRELIGILESQGFVLERRRGSHRIYKGRVGGKARLVVVAGHRESDDIKPGTLRSIIRQSGLPKRIFRF